MTQLNTPLSGEKISSLHAGDVVYLSGVIYAARDAAHKKMTADYHAGNPLPIDVKDQIIYYVGPTPEKPGQAIGSAGPTTSGRMDAYTPLLLSLGLKGMIGKGLRAQPVLDAMKKYKAVYFGAVGGAGALLSKKIVENTVIAYPELGPEALRKLTVKDFPLTVIIDCHGNNLYESAPAKYQAMFKESETSDVTQTNE